LSFNRTQSRVVIGLLAGHNTLRRHLYILELSNNSICRKYGTEEEISVHILCECEVLAPLRHKYPALGSCESASLAKYEERKTNRMQQLDVYY
jgi:hypothetical protein